AVRADLRPPAQQHWPYGAAPSEPTYACRRSSTAPYGAAPSEPTYACRRSSTAPYGAAPSEPTYVCRRSSTAPYGAQPSGTPRGSVARFSATK
ncbi:MAG TPA: hypothetical protein VH877_03800, partial [Polyangia bacterium]|nr:hypothetical protein [Polyangia bacterium]